MRHELGHFGKCKMSAPRVSGEKWKCFGIAKWCANGRMRDGVYTPSQRFAVVSTAREPGRVRIAHLKPCLNSRKMSGYAIANPTYELVIIK